MRVKQLLLAVGLSTLLSVYGAGHGKAQENRNLAKNLSGYGHALVQLSKNSERSIITAESGWHIETFAKYAEVTPIIPNRKYSRFSVAFPDSSKLEKRAKELDKNNDKIIDLNELYKIY